MEKSLIKSLAPGSITGRRRPFRSRIGQRSLPGCRIGRSRCDLPCTGGRLTVGELDGRAEDLRGAIADLLNEAGFMSFAIQENRAAIFLTVRHGPPSIASRLCMRQLAQPYKSAHCMLHAQRLYRAR